ncbi:MAG: GNAT family N-acetyltransferase [Alphaproteobacteria bacterium]|nr:GNAT family N-acetyltransferase [Alphaproteobacteria bacterium]
MTTTVTLEVAAPTKEPVLANLIQLYTHDFSDFWARTPRGDIGEDGRFAPYPYLPSYWTDETRVPLLLRVDGHIAGFALLNRHGHLRDDLDRNMAEFFVLRKYRRGGIGTAAMDTIYRRYPGVWETAVVRKNVQALAFWRRVIRAHPLVSDVEEADLSTEAWNGPVLRYRVRSLSSA